MATVTNSEIIRNECMLRGFDPEAEYFTFAQWQFRGYSVKKGEHAIIRVGLWVPCTASKKELEVNPEAKVKCYLKTSFLFTVDQVEPIKQRTISA